MLKKKKEAQVDLSEIFQIFKVKPKYGSGLELVSENMIQCFYKNLSNN